MLRKIKTQALKFRVAYFRWSLVSAFMRLRLAQTASLIPVFGYAIIWNDALSPILSWRGDDRGLGLFLPETRLYLLYFGSVLLTFGLLVFVCFCPGAIKKFPDVEDFAAAQDVSVPRVDREKQILFNAWLVEPSPYTLIRQRNNPTDPNSGWRDGVYENLTSIHAVNFEYSSVVGNVLRAEWPPGVVGNYSISGRKSRMIYKIQYLQSEDRSPKALILCIAFCLCGAVLVLLPSVEVFIMASGTALGVK